MYIFSALPVVFGINSKCHIGYARTGRNFLNQTEIVPVISTRSTSITEAQKIINNFSSTESRHKNNRKERNSQAIIIFFIEISDTKLHSCKETKCVVLALHGCQSL